MASRSLLPIGLTAVTALLLIAQNAFQIANAPTVSETYSTVTAQVAQQETVTLHLEDESLQHQASPNAKSVKPKKRNTTLLRAVDQEDIQPHHRLLADTVLRSIDEGCKNGLVNFYVRYDNPESRGLGGGSTIIITGNVSDDEFRALLIHECGHVIDTGIWRGTQASGASAYKDGTTPVYNDDVSIDFYRISWKNSSEKNAGWKQDDFVSGYAASDPFEDFAETFAYFTLQRGAFEKRAQTNSVILKKLEFMETHVSSTNVAEGKSVWNGEVQWDSTKLPYKWIDRTAQFAQR